MRLADPWILHFLWVVPIAGLALIIQSRMKKRALAQLADKRLLLRLSPGYRKGSRFLKALFLLLSLMALILALAGPRWGSHYQEVTQKSVDIMMLVDVSPSMQVEDVKPNRLERARREMIDFLNVVQGDRVGLVPFSGVAFVQCPLTLDYEALRMFLRTLKPGFIPVPGTDMGEAIRTGLSAFDFESETDKVILLITDGEDNEHRGMEAARLAAEKSVRVFIFGIGETAGGPVPSGDGKGGFKKNKEGKLVLSKLDEAGLNNIASITGGAYARSVTGDLDLDSLYFDGIKQATTAQTVKSGKIRVYEERFVFFVLSAFLFLTLEGFIEETTKKKLGTTHRFFIPFFLFMGIQFVFSIHAAAAEKPDALYKSGRFEEAKKAYADLDMDHPKDVRYRYNRGCAAYQSGQYPEAFAAFSSALKRAQDNDLRFKAAFNLGNTMYRQNDFESAAMYYRQALGYNPTSEDTRYNLELALRSLGKMEQKKAETLDDQAQDKPDKKPNESETETKGGDEKSGEKSSNKKDSDKNASETQQKRQASNQNSTQEKESAHNDNGKLNTADKKDAKDLSGELKPLQALPEKAEEGESHETANPNMSRKMAESLLDNIQEDPSKILRFVIPQEKMHRVPSGKDW